ncbi:MAG: hypothetical protein ACRD10_12920 [Terriglobia bacterium]
MSIWITAASRAYRQTRRLIELAIGLIFMLLAGLGTSVSLSEWDRYVAHRSAGLVRFYLYSGFTIVLALFCLYSFLKARSIR